MFKFIKNLFKKEEVVEQEVAQEPQMFEPATIEGILNAIDQMVLHLEQNDELEDLSLNAYIFRNNFNEDAINDKLIDYDNYELFFRTYDYDERPLPVLEGNDPELLNQLISIRIKITKPNVDEVNRLSGLMERRGIDSNDIEA